MASERPHNPMKRAHIKRLQENWNLVEQFLEFNDVLYILKEKGVLDKRDIELIEGYSKQDGFRYLFGALTEYGGTNGFHGFVEALKTKHKKYATIISELSEEFSEREQNVESDDKDAQISTLEKKLRKEKKKRKELEEKLKKMKTESASKDKEIHRLTDELNDVTQRVKSLETTIDDMRTFEHPGMKQTLQEMIRSELDLMHVSERKTRPGSTKPLSGTQQQHNQRKTSVPKGKFLPHLQTPRK